MTLHEFWRAEYRKKRYLEHVGQDDLEQRVRDIFTNMLELTPEGKLGFPPVDRGSRYWIKVWTDVLEELVLRNGYFRPGFLKGAPVPRGCWPNVPRAYAALGGRDFGKGACLFKFGKAKYLHETLASGRLRVASASSYSDPSLNYAIKDDELSFTIQVPGDGVFIQKVDESTLKPVGEKIPVMGNITQTHRTPTDYLVFCMSASYELRAIDDFEGDCCLVIKDVKAFLDRLLKGVLVHVPYWAARVGPVVYLDPLNTKPQEVRPYFGKYFRYAYQNEVRVVWVPPEPTAKVEPVFTSLGSLQDIAELLVVRDAR
jgi:hypothetical protein